MSFCIIVVPNVQRHPGTRGPSIGELFRLAELDEDHVKAIAFNMLFVVWRKRTLAAVYRRSMAIASELSAQFPEGVGVCQIVEVDTTPPDSDARRAFVEFMKVDTVRHFSVIHDGTGFKAASVRAIMSSVHMLGRPKFKMAVHSSVPAAAAWHAVEQVAIGRRETPELIERVVRGLRQLHRDRYPNST
ncbi:MAG: hypothetical protein WBY94_06480 [Polyangiaceae bacterium]